MEGKGFLEVENWEVEEEESDSSSSKQRSGRSLKEEQAKWVDGDDDVSWILTVDLPHDRHICFVGSVFEIWGIRIPENAENKRETFLFMCFLFVFLFLGGLGL